MPKLLHIQCLIADHHLHDVMLFLEERRAYNLQVSAYKDMVPNSNGARSVRGTQLDWLVKHIKEETQASDIKEAFIKAGFRKSGFYGALDRAAKLKMLKKVRPGVYKPLNKTGE